MEVLVQNVEMRSYIIKRSTSPNARAESYVILYFEDFHGASHHVPCWDIDMVSRNFRKGEVCDLVCKLDLGKFTNFELISITGAFDVSEAGTNVDVLVN